MSAPGWAVAVLLVALAAQRAPKSARRQRRTPAAEQRGPARGVERHPIAARARLEWDRITDGSARRRDEQLCVALEHMASSLRAGTTLVVAVASATTVTRGPVGRELAHVASAARAGSPLSVALDRWLDRAGGHGSTRLTATALRLAAGSGGEIARSVDRVAATVRERRELRAEARALATQARASAAVLTIAPLAFTAVIASIEPGAVRFLVGSPLGVACLAAGLGLDALGALWMARIVRSPA